MEKSFVVTVDGPAGAGKSTIAKKFVEEFGFVHLDSGAVYRTIGILCKEKGVNPEDESSVVRLLESVEIEVKSEGVFVNGENYEGKIRTLEGGRLASVVAKHPKVRERVVKILRKSAVGKRVVVDGRDAGTNIFPDAQVKIFLTASSEERARRRYQELKNRGEKVSYEEVLEEVKRRDREDTNRKVAPLRIPEGAVKIDTSEKSIEQVWEEVKNLVKLRLK
jgi:cytidylate kinase